MSTPSPIALKKQLDAKRANEPTQPEKPASSRSASSRKGKGSAESNAASESTARSPRKATPKKSDQKPFIERNPHLTQKLEHHEGLKTLLSSMGGSDRRNGNTRAPRTVPRPNSKAKQSTNKKESK